MSHTTAPHSKGLTTYSPPFIPCISNNQEIHVILSNISMLIINALYFHIFRNILTYLRMLWYISSYFPTDNNYFHIISNTLSYFQILGNVFTHLLTNISCSNPYIAQDQYPRSCGLSMTAIAHFCGSSKSRQLWPTDVPWKVRKDQEFVCKSLVSTIAPKNGLEKWLMESESRSEIEWEETV